MSCLLSRCTSAARISDAHTSRCRNKRMGSPNSPPPPLPGKFCTPQLHCPTNRLPEPMPHDKLRRRRAYSDATQDVSAETCRQQQNAPAAQQQYGRRFRRRFWKRTEMKQAIQAVDMERELVAHDVQTLQIQCLSRGLCWAMNLKLKLKQKTPPLNVCLWAM